MMFQEAPFKLTSTKNTTNDVMFLLLLSIKIVNKFASHLVLMKQFDKCQVMII